MNFIQLKTEEKTFLINLENVTDVQANESEDECNIRFVDGTMLFFDYDFYEDLLPAISKLQGPRLRESVNETEEEPCSSFSGGMKHFRDWED